MARHLSKVGESRSIRTFLAVELPAAHKRKLAALEPDFARHATSLKWVAPPRLHLTVKFLGGVPEPQLVAVGEAALRSTSRVRPFSLRLSGLGAFPSERAPRVLWVGLERDAGFAALERLFHHLEDELASLGFPREERQFSPHITLARVRDGASTGERRLLGETLLRVHVEREVRGEFPVRQLVVMRSDLSPAGPAYTPILIAPLDQANDLEAGTEHATT